MPAPTSPARAQVLAKRRPFVSTALRRLGLDALFNRLHPVIRDHFIFTYPRPFRTAPLPPELAADPDAPKLVKHLDHLLHHPFFDPLGNARKCSVADYFAVLHPLLLITRESQRNPSNITKQFAPLAAALAPLIDAPDPDLLATGNRQLGNVTVYALCRHARLDAKYFTLRTTITPPAPAGPPRPTHEVTLAALNPQTRTFTLDGQPRRAFRLHLPFIDHAARPLEWTPDEFPEHLFPESRPNRPIPVYIQSHALHRLRARLPDLAGPPDAFDRPLHALVLSSAVRPVFVRRDHHGTLWLEFRDFNDLRLGYLLADLTPDRSAAVIRTFLFLTMTGSPEHDRLRTILGARHTDIRRLRLDQLNTYTRTDLPDATDLHPYFQACHCAHLFQLKQLWNLRDPLTHATPTAPALRAFFDRDQSPLVPIPHAA